MKRLMLRGFETSRPRAVDRGRLPATRYSVMPVQAGIHLRFLSKADENLDTGLRRYDELRSRFSVKGFRVRQFKAGRYLVMLATLLALLPTLPAYAAESKFDWKGLEAEAVTMLSRYIQVDTTNPPGNEIKGAQFLKTILDREGIEARVIESAPGRANLYARLKGSGAKKPIVLMHHMDVVPAEARLWKEPPFSGVVKDGVIWGRGSLDNKGGGVMALMTLLALKRQNIQPKGDIIFLGTADEEAGGVFGAGFLLDKHPELFKDVSVVFNEGGGIRVGDDGKARQYSVGVAEKVPLWLKLTAPGTPGHAASPGDNQAVLKLVAALNRLANFQTPIKVTPEVQKFYADSAASAPANRREQYLDLRKALQDSSFAAEFLKDRSNNARVRNTISITGIKGSEKINVIAAEASAEVDVRLLPGEEAQMFIAELRKVLADESIKIEVLLSRTAATSPLNPEAMKVITDYAKAHDPEATILFPVGSGFTDCHFFRAKGIPCLGFSPQRSTASSEGLVHGVDERVAVERLTTAIRAIYEIVSKLAVE
ncbi:MAG: M20/M25/M40 family metallo-hydrolase [Deltaproteobacteria bacterium]|nr:M20/M25/M40 family metallo-hydrolase [Deltaproteobacteria bacterium]